MRLSTSKRRLDGPSYASLYKTHGSRYAWRNVPETSFKLRVFAGCHTTPCAAALLAPIYGFGSGASFGMVFRCSIYRNAGSRVLVAHLFRLKFVGRVICLTSDPDLLGACFDIAFNCCSRSYPHYSIATIRRIASTCLRVVIGTGSTATNYYCYSYHY